MADTFQRFSAIQYYLAHARNTVHAMFEIPRAVAEDDFMDFVSSVINAAPQMLWRESLTRHGHYRDVDVDWSSQCVYVAATSMQEANTQLAAEQAKPLQDTGRPAFLAICQVITDGARPHTRILVYTTHALMEGGDVADLLRGRRSSGETRPSVEAGLSKAGQIGALAISPLLWLIHVNIARFERKERANFGFAALSFDREDLRRVAGQMGMGQRDLAFALVSHHRRTLPKPKKKLFAAYSSRPPARVHLCDDEFLSLRIDEISVPCAEDFTEFAGKMRDALAKRGRNPMFVQTWQRRLNQIHRYLHPRLPWLYPHQLFGYAPYDVVLSLIPPVRIRTAAPVLEGATVYAGSDTGTAESCIFAASERAFTVTLWSGADRDAHLRAIEQTAAGAGIKTQRPLGA